MCPADPTPPWPPLVCETLNEYGHLLRDLLRDAPLEPTQFKPLRTQLTRHPYVLPEIVPSGWMRREEYRLVLEELGTRLRRSKVTSSALKRELARIIERVLEEAYLEQSARMNEGMSVELEIENLKRKPRALRLETREIELETREMEMGRGAAGGGGGGGGAGGGGGRPRDRGRSVRSANGGGRVSSRNGGDDPPDLLLGAEPPDIPATEEPAPAPRWINAGIENHDKTKALKPKTAYWLAFDVDVRARMADDPSVTASAPLDLPFPEGVDQIQLTVQLETSDFKIAGGAQKLTLKRTGPSLDRARFEITPIHLGEGKIDAIFHKDGNFVQRLSLTLQVGEAAAGTGAMTSMGTGRPLAAAATVGSRDVSILVENRDGKYEMSLLKPVGRRVTLTVNEKQLEERLEEVRKVLLQIVQQTDPAGKKVFQIGLQIDPASNEAALRSLADVGFRLYSQLFFRPGAGSEARKFGENLRKRLLDNRCNVQITNRSFPIPWGLLYLAEKWEPEKPVDPDLFLGLRHVIEQIPLIETDEWPAGNIPSDQPVLSVSLNVNLNIDTQMRRPFVKDQIAYWKGLAGGRNKRVKYVVRDSAASVKTALEDGKSDDHLVYLYCHATTYGLGEAGGPDASSLIFEDGKRLTLGELYQSAGSAGTLRSSPLVFINACESAELSPLFYDGFVPYFMTKGARGAIGTECATPALFAAEWARRFFDLFLAGVPIGECVYLLRREFYQQHGNILGLLYSVHCDGDTKVAPSVLAN